MPSVSLAASDSSQLIGLSLPNGVNVTASIVGSSLRSSGTGAPIPRLTPTVGISWRK